MRELNDSVIEINKVKRIFKDNRLQTEYENRLKTFLKPQLTIEQKEKIEKVKKLSAKFFEKLTKNTIDPEQTEIKS